MKHILTLLLLIVWSGALGQKPGREFNYNGVPGAGLRFQYFQPGYVDWVKNRQTGYKYYLLSGVWTLDPTSTGGGGGGTNIVFVSVTTLTAGSSATGSISGDTLYLGIPRGSTGPAGTSGSGSSWLANVLTGPDKYGAVHDSTITFASQGHNQAYVDSGWPGIGATTASRVDWAAWQMATNEATDQRKEIKTYGHYYVNQPIVPEKYYAELVMSGPGYVHATGTSSFAIFKRPDPTDNGDANVMIGCRFIVRDMSFGGNGTSLQTGLNMGPSYMSRYDNTRYFNLDTAIMQRFQLGTMITNIEVNNAGTPFGRIGIWTGIGNWSGASGSNSQSNSTIIKGSRFYMTNNTSTAVKVFSCSGVDVDNIIIEGSVVLNGIDFDANSSTVVKDFSVRKLHFECNPNGAVNAAVKVRMAGGIPTLDGAFGQYASILMDAGATVGYVAPKISNVPYWVPKSGKYFNNAGNTYWDLDWNDNMFANIPEIPSKFSGTPVTLIAPATINNSGPNRVTYPTIISK